MAYPEDPLEMRIRIAPGADLTAMPDTYSWSDITSDVSFRSDRPIEITVGQQDEQQEGQASTTLALRNHESHVVDADGNPWVAGAEPGPAGRYTTDNPLSDLWPGWALGCPVEIAVRPAGSGDWHVRAVQYAGSIADEWPSSTATDWLTITNVELAGLIRRCQAKKDAKSALYRALLPVGWEGSIGSDYRYWPMESASVGTTLTQRWPSPIPGCAEARTRAAYAGSMTGPVGSLAVPRLTNPGTDGTSSVDAEFEFSDSPATTGLGVFWSFGFVFVAEQGDSVNKNLARKIEFYLRGGGTWAQTLDANNNPVANMYLTIYAERVGDNWTADGHTGIDLTAAGGLGFSSVTETLTLNLFDGNPHYVVLQAGQALGGCTAILLVDGEIVGQTSGIAGTMAMPYKAIARSTVYTTTAGGTGDNSGSSIGLAHVFWRGGAFLNDPSWIGVGAPGELAHDRIGRLSAEEGVPFSSSATNSVALGPLGVTDYVTAIREAEKWDRGIIDDSLGYILYVSSSELVNTDPTLELDGSLGQVYQPIAPVTDDSKVRNDVTMTRPGGVAQRVSDEAHVAKVGRYSAGETPSAETDSGALAQAGWSVHVGTFGDGNAKREGSLRLNLQTSSELIDDWLAMRPGDVVRRSGMPLAYRPGSVDVQARGWVESFTGRRKWTATLNTVPYAPYEVAGIEVADSTHPNRGRLGETLDTSGDTLPPLNSLTTLVTAIDPDDTTTKILNTARPFAWTTDADDFSPAAMAVNLEGEHATVSGIADIWADVFSRTSAAGSWGSADGAGGAYTLVGTAADFSVGSGVGSIVCGASASDRIAYVTGLACGGDQIARVDVRASSGSALPLNSSGYFAGLILRRDSVTGDFYQFSLFVNSTSGAMNARISRVVGGVATTISTFALPWTFTVNRWFTIIGYAVGTALKAKVYPALDFNSATAPEWPTWQIETTNASIPSASTADRMGVLGRVDDGSTTHTWQYDNARLLTPQAVTLSARALNDVSKSHAAGSDFRLWLPAAYALAGRT